MKQLSKEQLAALQAPIPAEAITTHPSKTYLSTIKAIYVIERLNEVFGPGEWRTTSKIVPMAGGEPYIETTTSRGRSMYTVLMDTIFEVPEYGIYYRVSASSTNDDIGDAAKGATTAGISKCASYLGIGMDVYKGRGSGPKKNNAPAPHRQQLKSDPLAKYRKGISEATTPDEFEALSNAFAGMADAKLKSAVKKLLADRMKAAGIGYSKEKGFHRKNAAA
jgi:hypothetical protein